MCATSNTIEPVYSDAEREELGHLDYFVARLDDLCQRRLLTPEACATVVAESRGRRAAIDLTGRYNGAIAHARKLAKSYPREALEWAELARGLDPSRIDAWKLIVALNWDLGNDEDAVARCGEAAERFPEFQTELYRLKVEQARRGDERRHQAEKARQDAAATEWLALAKLALEEKRDADVIALCRQILAIRPDNVDTFVMMAYAQQRSGQLDAALESYEILSRLQPFNKTWLQWIKSIQLRRGVARLTGTSVETTATAGAAGDRAVLHAGENAGPLPISWSSFAAEFLEEHWQKLILCLAVLLIVVSSTVGAHLLLGPLLWSAVGKCTLAMVATLLFAAFGAGLIRWGADRAGRVMLVATLIVVPIHFMLVGEMKLLRDPSALNVAFLAMEGAVLVAMVRWVSGMLAPAANARFLTAALLLLSLGTAATTRGSPTASGLQLASFELSPLVFLGAVWILGARRWGATSEQHREFVYMALGLLGFALVACLARTGGYALRLDAALYALPAMLIAVSCVHAARRLDPDEPDKERLAFLRLGGYALSGLAFALVLARPPTASSVYSANTLAVSLLGLGLYAGSLKLDRHPAFLYLAVGAIVAGRMGAHYFLADRWHAIEEVVRRLLGYPHVLPTPFRAILAVVPSTALAWLARWFPRHWDDRRLAR
ncbi:MAG TPA: tetratricopeptide repeat protein, partial [Isosphaeraceae bacterium]|nr:tetratricopeptide repeat protein [Isosphaeraceae bacterium]